ncbi:MAG: mRNA interferase RelE/StbE [Thermomicrobiales bacterium]|jgi:mRNA interferase RelE/StbE|nr:mRNA interferase RelE/StbE [Thermomicrobiales bacterium]
MSTRLVWTERSLDDIRKLDTQTRDRVLAAVERLATTGHGDVRRLEGPAPEWRLRVGDWRVRFTHEPDHQTILVLRVLPRGRAYRR